MNRETLTRAYEALKAVESEHYCSTGEESERLVSALVWFEEQLGIDGDFYDTHMHRRIAEAEAIVDE